MAKIDQLENMLLREIPARRWFLIAQRLDQTAEDIMQSALAMMVVAANERHRAETGKDDFARFLDMAFLDLVDASGLNELVDESGDADPKSGDASGDLLAGEGPVLSGDGPDAD